MKTIAAESGSINKREPFKIIVCGTLHSAQLTVCKSFKRYNAIRTGMWYLFIQTKQLLHKLCVLFYEIQRIRLS